jgi:hypothetical protein
MVMPRGRKLLPPALGGAALVLVAWWWLRPASAPAPAPRSRPTAANRPGQRGRATELVGIDLARLDTRGDTLKAGKRDIFDFVALPPPPPPPTAPPAPPTTLSPTQQAEAEKQRMDEERRRALPPPLNVKYIGAMEDKHQGLKVAILLTDRQEILTGRPGEVVANRLKIVAIGLESVDVQDVGWPNVRRIALKGN